MAYTNLGSELMSEALRLQVATIMCAENSTELSHTEEWHHVDNTRHRPFRINDEQPLVDTTEKMTLRSKRTGRLQRKMQKKDGKHLHSQIHSFLDLLPELLSEVLTYLAPSDIFSLLRVSRSARDYVQANENGIGNEIISLRYSILARCFPLPVPLENVDERVHPVILSLKHQQRLVIHKAPYLHVLPSDPGNTCSCMACVLAWNNLCLIVDLAHWQNNLDEREPIPMLGRGMRPAWNVELVQKNARIVNKAIRSPLWWARVLQRHLHTTVVTIVRSAAVRKKTGPADKNVHPSKRLYHLSNEDMITETDSFLQRSGPPSFEFPFTRDNYYMLLSYIPNRRWDSQESTWLYYGALHDNDLAWATRMYEQEQERLRTMAESQKSAIADSASPTGPVQGI